MHTGSRNESPAGQNSSSCSTPQSGRPDEDAQLIDIILTASPGTGQLPNKFIRLGNYLALDSAHALLRVAVYCRTNALMTVGQLRKFLSMRLGNSPDDYDVTCGGELLGTEYTLVFVQKTRWHAPGPMQFAYSCSRSS